MPKMKNLQTPASAVVILAACLAISLVLPEAQAGLPGEEFAKIKSRGFRDPYDGTSYSVISYNVTRMAAGTNHRSEIRISKVRHEGPNQVPVGVLNRVQTIKYNPELVDFDLHCQIDHCYLVSVLGKSRQNVKLYKWSRTQFDDEAVRDSFARPHSVKLFNIGPQDFYIAIAQEQLHLWPYRRSTTLYDENDDTEPARFIGCAILKFTKKREHSLKYHQFIRLPFNPLHVHYSKAINSNYASDALAVVQPSESHYLVFSLEPNWADPGASQTSSFLWSPLNDHFWPHRMPRDAEVTYRPYGGSIVKLPTQLPVAPSNQTKPEDYLAPVEECFHQLQRLLADRERKAQALLETSKSIWRAPIHQQRPIYGRNQFQPQPNAGLTDISAQLIVHGNVLVRGGIIESPQITLVRGSLAPGLPLELPLSIEQVAHSIKTHSPVNVENKFRQAHFKLGYIREKLKQAVLANWLPQVYTFNNQIRFFGGIEAREVLFAGGLMNSNVRLNGLPFAQLENELVSLNGPQDIGTRVVFEGRVVADLLEIHGRINDRYFLRDALDITSRRVQVIDTTGQNYAMRAPGMAPVSFASLGAPGVILAHNASLNDILLSDFITRDERTQYVLGRKSFKRLAMGRLNLAHQNVALNDFNLSRIARNSIRLRPEPSILAGPNARLFQTLGSSGETNFMGPVRVNKLSFSNMLNSHINLTSLIHDSVKTNDPNLQQIFGQKNFLDGVKINRLTTEGALNGIVVSQIFNLNPAPPIAEHYRYQNGSYPSQFDVPIEGNFRFKSRSRVLGSMNAGLVNGVDLVRRAIKRSRSQGIPSRPQIVRGHKTFYRPLRVMDTVRLVDFKELNNLMANVSRVQFPYPLVNNIDLRAISAGLERQMRTPSPIFVENLEIDGNLVITSSSLSGSIPPGLARSTLGRSPFCQLDAIRSRSVLAGLEDQIIEAPLFVNQLRAKSIVLENSGPLNDFNFPNDFVLRTLPTPVMTDAVEPVFGTKTFEHLVVAPSVSARAQTLSGTAPAVGRQGIVLDRGVSINQVGHYELQTFIQHERLHNSTGEKVFNTMNVYGNLQAKRINGYYWPEDILQKSLSSSQGLPQTPYLHKRIYSHLIFTNYSNLRVENQLVLRGPIQLNGRMNGVNLTEFSRQSATYGDKDLFSAGRPIRNKIFLGGLTVKGEIRSQGLIDGVNIDEMRRRVVTINPRHGPARLPISSPKIFMSDVTFESPVGITYLNDLPIDHYLRRIRFEPDGRTLRVFGRKSITGALRINRNLFVRGLINGVDFVELQARAISLSPPSGELKFNRTLTVEGDVFMDNLYIDERNGTIDGVKLTNLMPIAAMPKNEIILAGPRVERRAFPQGRSMRVEGSFADCQVTCDLQRVGQNVQQVPVFYSSANQTFQPTRTPNFSAPPGRPVIWPSQSVQVGTTRPVILNQKRSFNLTRTTPPYGLSGTYRPALMQVKREGLQSDVQPSPIVQERQLQNLAQRQPISIRYEQRNAPSRRYATAPERTTIVVEQLEILRKHIVSINLVRLTTSSNLVAGFIEAPTNEIANYILPDQEIAHFDHYDPFHRAHYLHLDQIDFPYNNWPTIFHLSVGVATNQRGYNVTSVFSSSGGGNLTELSALPVVSPNSAAFIPVHEVGALFLMVSQDYKVPAEVCPTSEFMISNGRKYLDAGQQPESPGISRAENGVHVYLFHALQNSSSLTSAYFDLYQTLDLQSIDSFERFSYHGSTYVLAISRALGRVHLLLLRGYSGFQMVSHIEAPGIESVRVMFSQDQKPVLAMHQTSGLYRIMEAVII